MRCGRALYALALGLPLAAQQIPVIRVPVRLVSLPTLVFSSENRLILNLRAEDFHIVDNGRLQTVILDTNVAPVSVAIAVQANQDVREYLPFIAKVGSAIDALLVGETGEAVILTYGDEVKVANSFESQDVRSTLKKISAAGKQARMLDAGSRAIGLLATRPRSRTRILIFVSQPMDRGSESSIMSLIEDAERENVTVHTLALPLFGKAFVSDTFSLQGAEKGGLKAGVDLGKLVSVPNRIGRVETETDPFSMLTAGTGGLQLHFRNQHQLEDAIAAIGVALRSAYLLSYYPNSTENGYHSVKVEVDVPGSRVYTRRGYWLSAE